MPEKHIFALYVHNLSSLIQDDTKILLRDTHLVHRITHVVRLQQGDTCIFFDRVHNITVHIIQITKKEVQAAIVNTEKNKKLLPNITLLLPILKKDALSEAVYNAVEVGANKIQLVQASKASRTISPHEFERLERVAIAAAEQSKNFAVPYIEKPIAFEEAIQLFGNAKLFFDPAGKEIRHAIDDIQEKSPASIILLVGPEGDLTKEEKTMLNADQDWFFIALTPTILRSVQAVSVGLGVIRSALR